MRVLNENSKIKEGDTMKRSNDAAFADTAAIRAIRQQVQRPAWR
jgi:hypothetical protein